MKNDRQTINAQNYLAWLENTIYYTNVIIISVSQIWKKY